MQEFVSIGEAEAHELASSINFLLVTATVVETEALLAHFAAVNQGETCLKAHVSGQTYYVGRFGRHLVAHVQCQMGSISAGGSINTVSEAIKFWGVKAVVMLGIAFGIDRKAQNIGDVLISKTIIPYDIKRVGAKDTQRRGAIPPCGPTLLNKFSNAQNWSFPLQTGANAKAEPVDLLSGESLIDNIDFRDELLADYPQARGGEMEGAGVFAAAHQNHVEWILVKAICDFADGFKSEGKKENQRIAAAAAVSYCLHVFSEPHALDVFTRDESHSISRPQTPAILPKDALFDVYQGAFEPAYLERDVDAEIAARIHHQGVWLAGPTGCGKTNILRRALILNGKTFFFVDLSKAVGALLPELLTNLHLEIAEAMCVSAAKSPSVGEAASTRISAICKTLTSTPCAYDAFFIDEIPIASEDEFQGFTEAISAIIITLANQSSPRPQFYLSSLYSPKRILKPFHKKVHEHIHFRDLPIWTPEEMRGLLEKLLPLLSIKLLPAEQNQILAACKGCPRDLKQILRTCLLFKGNSLWPLSRIIEETRST